MKTTCGFLLRGAHLLFLGTLLTATLLISAACTSGPGSASNYANPHRSYIGPGYGGAPSSLDGYASGVPSVSGRNVNSWYNETRP